MKIFKLGFLGGLIFALISITISFVWYKSGLAEEGINWPSYIYYFLFPCLIFGLIFYYRKIRNNQLSIEHSLAVGMIAVLISGIMYIIYQILFYTVIDPEFTSRVVNKTMDANNQYSEEEKRLAKEMVKGSSGTAFSIIGIVVWMAFNLFLGAIYSLVSGLILRKKKIPEHI